MFKSLSAANLYQSIIVMGSLAGLALIGGLAVFCFTKAFGIVFLGEPRSKQASNAREVRKNMIYPQYIIIAFILLIGLASAYFVKPVFSLVSQEFNITDVMLFKSSSINNLTQISLIGGIFILTIVILLVYRHFHLKTKQIETGPTWGCGYTAATSKHQYTATSYADNYHQPGKSAPAGQKKSWQRSGRMKSFPEKGILKSISHDFFKKIPD